MMAKQRSWFLCGWVSPPSTLLGCFTSGGYLPKIFSVFQRENGVTLEPLKGGVSPPLPGGETARRRESGLP
jgi:hypothetical protein